MSSIEIASHSVEQTHELGRQIGAAMKGGELIALCGPLGAGKTQFAKGFAVGLQIPPAEPIVSPTFVIVREYAGRLRLHHFDVYRLGGPAELESLGFDEMRNQPDAVVIVEWADRFPELLAACDLRLELQPLDQNRREIQIQFDPQRFPEFCNQLTRLHAGK